MGVGDAVVVVVAAPLLEKAPSVGGAKEGGSIGTAALGATAIVGAAELVVFV